MKLNEIKDRPSAIHAKKRVGRGIGSGRGKTCGSGHKGQKARSGVSINGFEGGQMPIHRRLPKRGFTNIFRKNYVEVNLGRIQAALDAGKLERKQPVDAEALKAAGVISKIRDGVRILGKGEIKDSLDIQVAGASRSAIEAVAKAGGKLTVIDSRAKSGAKSEKDK